MEETEAAQRQVSPNLTASRATPASLVTQIISHSALNALMDNINKPLGSAGAVAALLVIWASLLEIKPQLATLVTPVHTGSTLNRQGKPTV
jgi:hypothetical protein